jgi:hypothetical protein
MPAAYSGRRTVTIWIVSNGSNLLPANGSSLSRIAFLSGPIWDRANRVTQACHLKRIVFPNTTAELAVSEIGPITSVHAPRDFGGRSLVGAKVW